MSLPPHSSPCHCYRHCLLRQCITGGVMNGGRVPIVYKVDHIRDRDGKSFATQRVDATQKENIVFTLLASFQKEELGFDHQEVAMPSMPPPDKLLSMEELRERCLTDPRLPK
ncbi:Acyl-CoA thioesterase [Arachis hypogaea]|nr:Acyl-CoA thioesterase [Arachis hypogaea]